MSQGTCSTADSSPTVASANLSPDQISAAYRCFEADGRKHLKSLRANNVDAQCPLQRISVFVERAPGTWIATFVSSILELIDDAAGRAWRFIFIFRIKFDHEVTIENCPLWPCVFLQKIASYSVQTRNLFTSGEYFPLSPVFGEHPLFHAAALAFTQPLLSHCPPLLRIGTTDIKVLEIYPVSAEEMALLQRWDADSFARVLQRHGLYVGTPQRTCVLTDQRHCAAREEALKLAAEEGARVDTYLFNGDLQTVYENESRVNLTIMIPKMSVRLVTPAFLYRLCMGKFVTIEGGYLDAQMAGTFACTFAITDSATSKLDVVFAQRHLRVSGDRERMVRVASHLLAQIDGSRLDALELSPEITLRFDVVSHIEVIRQYGQVACVYYRVPEKTPHA